MFEKVTEFVCKKNERSLSLVNVFWDSISADKLVAYLQFTNQKQNVIIHLQKCFIVHLIGFHRMYLFPWLQNHKANS